MSVRCEILKSDVSLIFLLNTVFGFIKKQNLTSPKEVLKGYVKKKANS